MPVDPGPGAISPINTVTTSVGVPTVPANIVVEMMRRRSGWFTTLSDSAVVNPAPLIADRAWNDAASGGRPVAMRAPVASWVKTNVIIPTTRNVATAYIAPSLADHADLDDPSTHVVVIAGLPSA